MNVTFPHRHAIAFVNGSKLHWQNKLSLGLRVATSTQSQRSRHTLAHWQPELPVMSLPLPVRLPLVALPVALPVACRPERLSVRLGVTGSGSLSLMIQ